MPATKTRRPAAPVTVKQGHPSKPGEKVETGKAKIVPPSTEVRIAQDAARSKAKTDAIVGKAVAQMTGKKATVKDVSAHRLTNVWSSKSGKDVQIKDKVKLADGTVVTCVGRWTKRKGEQKIPFITGTTADGTRRNSAASEVTHTK
jgi:hypothetical protein